MSDLKIIFHHTPKTAGTTFTALLDMLFDVDEIHPFDIYGGPDTELRAADIIERKDQIANYRLIRGHLPAAGFDTFEGYFRVTLLRHPYSRILSAYNDWRNKTIPSLEPANENYKSIAKMTRDNSIGALLDIDSPLVARIFDNRQTRAYLDDPLKEELGPEDLDQAKTMLDKMDLVGIAEHFESFLHVFYDRIGEMKPNQVQSLNVRSYNFDDHDVSKDRLYAFTQYDMELYRYAQFKFDQALNDLLNKSKSSSGHQVKPTPQSNIKINMHQGFRCEGFHVREGMDTPQPWRWTGPSKDSTVYISLEEHQDYKVELAIISVIDFKIVEGLQLSFNNSNLDTQYEGHMDGQHIISAVIIRDLISAHHLDELKLTVPFTLSHADVQPETNDYRQKGVAITTIEISPQD